MDQYGIAEGLLGAAVFLCLETAFFINGAVITVDGAFSAYSGV